MAVTVTYPDGLKIQLLPAVRASDGFRIPTAKGNDWSRIVRPEAFAQKLTEVNERCGGKLVPTIKLVKGANAQLPEQYSLSSYHIESLAVEAFKNYDGPKTTKAMVQRFFDQASLQVLRPIKDRTGQSLNVDEDLGPEGSNHRLIISGALSRMARSLKNADQSGSERAWLTTLGATQ